jgi:hypothetical protein
MLEEQINVFAKLLVQHVRDAAIQSRKVQLYTENLESPTAKNGIMPMIMEILKVLVR